MHRRTATVLIVALTLALGVVGFRGLAPAPASAAVLERAVASTAPAATSSPAPPATPTVVSAPTDSRVPSAVPATPSTIVSAAPDPVATAETWAIVIGVDRYNGHDIDLDAAVADAAAMVTTLDVAFGVDAEHQVVLTDHAVTRASVVTAIEWLVRSAGPEDRAVFFYAGHVIVQGGHESMLLPDGSTISDVELADGLRDLRAGATWLVLATCHAGGFDEAAGPGRILTAAAGAGELAYENLDFGHSYLVQYLIVDQLLAGESTSVETAFDAAMARLANDFPDRLPQQNDGLAGTFSTHV